jgi:hypothetical protein
MVNYPAYRVGEEEMIGCATVRETTRLLPHSFCMILEAKETETGRDPSRMFVSDYAGIKMCVKLARSVSLRFKSGVC